MHRIDAVTVLALYVLEFVDLDRIDKGKAISQRVTGDTLRIEVLVVLLQGTVGSAVCRPLPELELLFMTATASLLTEKLIGDQSHAPRVEVDR